MALILHKTRDPQLHIPGKAPLCSLGESTQYFLCRTAAAPAPGYGNGHFGRCQPFGLHQEHSHPFQESNFLELLRKELSSSWNVQLWPLLSWQRTSGTTVTLAWRGSGWHPAGSCLSWGHRMQWGGATGMWVLPVPCPHLRALRWPLAQRGLSSLM